MLTSSVLTNDKFDPPAFFIPTLKALGVLSMSVLVPTVYVILRHSPRTMSSLKWHLLNITVGL